VARHVAFLSRLFLVWSAINGIVAIAVFAFAISAASLALSSGAERPGTEVAAVVTAATLVVLSLAAATWTWVHYVCARGLTKSSPRARTLGVVLGLFNLMLFPFGTALGGYALWVLLDNGVRTSFEHRTRNNADMNNADM
jgi:hypothetical protein